MRYIIRLFMPKGGARELWCEPHTVKDICRLLYAKGVQFELYDTERHKVILYEEWNQ